MNVVALTGAGISAESGVKTFRGSDGLWEGHRIDEVATPEAFQSHPDLVYQFYNMRRTQLLDPNLKPNSGHLALADLEHQLRDHFCLITQNVDHLHEKAGSRRVLHMHGELQKIRCLQTERRYFWDKDLDHSTPHPEGLKARLRPDIVWFGEIPYHLEEIETRLVNCDYFLCIGTSGVVYPAAGFVQLTPPHCQKIEFNLEPTSISSLFDQTVIGPTSKTLPLWVEQFLKNCSS